MCVCVWGWGGVTQRNRVRGSVLPGRHHGLLHHHTVVREQRVEREREQLVSRQGSDRRPSPARFGRASENRVVVANKCIHDLGLHKRL